MKDEIRSIYYHMLKPHGRWYCGDIKKYVVVESLIRYPSWIRGDQYQLRSAEDHDDVCNLGSMQNFINNLEKV